MWVFGRLPSKETSKQLNSTSLAGADVNSKRDWGSGGTPLHYAASIFHYGCEKIVELLIANGGDVNTKDVNGWTPLDSANETNHPKTADLLRKHGGKTGEELKAEGK